MGGITYCSSRNLDLERRHHFRTLAKQLSLDGGRWALGIPGPRYFWLDQLNVPGTAQKRTQVQRHAMQQGGSLAANVGAKEFVPTPPGLSASASAQGLHKAASSSSLSSAAVNAPVFVPGGTTSGAGRPAAVDAKPFVPGSGGAGAQGKQAAAPKPPKGSTSPAKPQPRAGGPTSTKQQQGQQQQQQLPAASAGPGLPVQPALQVLQQAQPSGRAATPDLGLPEGDDLLGMTASTPGDGRDVAAQAAEMFRAFNPFPPGGRGRQQGQQQGQQQQPPPQGGAWPPRPGSAGRGGPPPSGYAAPGPPHGGGRGPQGPGGGGRGRGRGRRAGPAPNRPSAAFVVGPGRMLKAGHFASDALRQELQQRSYLTQAQYNPETEGDIGMPEVIQQYSTLYPLEDLQAASERISQALGVRTQVVKAISRVDGQAYALRRIDPRHVIPGAELLAAAEEAVEQWGPVSNHPNLVGLREAFIAAEMDSTPALFFSHDYHPGSLSLDQAHMQPTHTPQGLMRTPVTEEQLWSYLVQITAALRAVHSAGLTLRPAALAPSKVLLTTNGRVRVGCIGVQEVLASEGAGALAPGPEALAALQRQDLASLGGLLLVLACAGRGAAPSLDHVSAHFSRELCHVVAGLLAAGEGNGFASWRALAGALGGRVFEELDAASLYGDALLGELGRECENGRILRLLVKLNAVTERPELGGDTQWAETGDRYVAKLFRDFVFHQVDEEGAPLLDYGMVAEALNKADAGVPEKILLLSRDEVSMLVVSYADIKRCIQSSYAELRGRGGPGGGSGAMQRSKSKQHLQAGAQGEKRGDSAGGYY